MYPCCLICFLFLLYTTPRIKFNVFGLRANGRPRGEFIVFGLRATQGYLIGLLTHHVRVHTLMCNGSELLLGGRARVARG